MRSPWLLIGFSRVYLGVHYISDIWCGYLVGCMWLIIAITLSEWLKASIVFQRVKLSNTKKRFLSVFILFSLFSFYGVFANNYHPQLMPAVPNKTIPLNNSADIFHNEQSKYTEDLIGRRQEPINFIIEATNEQTLIRLLNDQGWHLLDDASITSVFRAFKSLISDDNYLSAPIYPSFWSAKVQDLAFRKLTTSGGTNQTHYLKIWKTNHQIKDKNIYVAMVHADNGFKWGVIPVINPDLNSEREKLYYDITQTGNVEYSQKIQIRKSEVGYNFSGDVFFSDGDIYEIAMP